MTFKFIFWVQKVICLDKLITFLTFFFDKLTFIFFNVCLIIVHTLMPDCHGIFNY